MTAAPPLRTMDRAALAYLLAVTVLVVLAAGRVARPLFWAAVHLGLAAGVLWLARSPRAPALLRWWYPALLVPTVFRLNLHLVPQVHPRDYDPELLALDRLLFGAHPGVYLEWLAGPAATTALRLCWLSYFVLPFLVGVPLYLRGGKGRAAFAETAGALSLGWYVSYLGYFFVPALGPGYLPEQVGRPPAAPGDATTGLLEVLWVLEGPRARDVFPSGHVLIALVSVWAAFRHRVAGRWLLAALAAGLVLGTVYLRFHYGVDVLAGAVLAGLIAAGATARRGGGRRGEGDACGCSRS